MITFKAIEEYTFFQENLLGLNTLLLASTLGEV